jgi:cephalosporin hydroxylase
MNILSVMRERHVKAFINYDTEAPILCKHAANSKAIVEIGAAFGASACMFLASMPEDGWLTSIDAFVTSPSGWSATPEACRRTVDHTLTVARLPLRVAAWNLLHARSEDVVKTWMADVDMLFVDGDHSYEACRFDVDNWGKFVRRGGVMLIHDSRREEGHPDNVFARGWQGPTKVANELLQSPDWKLVETGGSLTVWSKQ